MSGTLSRKLMQAGLVTLVAAACGGGRKQQAPSPMAPADAKSTPSADAATVSSADIARRPQESVEHILAGKVAGVVVGRNTEGALTVRIRGSSSFLGNDEPLYILDGMAFTPGSNGALTGINASDIESIRALKDPADLAYYGSRGANGVIIIKTKRPPPPPKP